ncbi:hypothetical protein A464_3643 [Salmonella bongori N268-08]|uniref:Uncharacterized protein n=1 Tax=Salmonella bongori N268-08 TaxID=1197719 RepID=S5NKL7_SALBN|nr:hypothetical protein A464_3643 [Salmonella bongori N268-08]
MHNVTLNLWIKSLSDKRVDDILVAHQLWHGCCSLTVPGNTD